VKNLSPEVWEVLNNYGWPGNIRELKNIIKRMVLLTRGEIAGIESLPEEMFLFSLDESQKEENDFKQQQEIMEKEMIEQALVKAMYNKTKAAKLLNIDRSTLYAKIEKWQIKS
jgi:two-component system response regulator HydG